MGAKSRRDFLGLCIASVPALAVANNRTPGNETAKAAYRTPASLERYIDPLPIPERLRPYGTSHAKDPYRIRILECKQQLHSQLPPTTLWGFEGRYPGPTPRDVLTILVRFEGYTGRYVFHCHMPEHEDNDMMRPYEVISQTQGAKLAGVQGS